MQLAIEQLQVKRGPTAFHRQVANVLEHQILSGEYRRGDRVATEQDLCGLFNVSRITIRQALKHLEDKGLISRGRGRGTFVTARMDDMPKAKLRIGIERATGPLTDFSIKLARRGTERTPFGAAKALNTAAREVFSYVTVVSGEGRPVATVKAYLPLEYRDLLTETDLSSGDTLPALAKRLGTSIRAWERSIEAIAALAGMANLLDVDISAPLLLVTQIARSTAGEPVEYRHTVYRGDAVSLSIFSEAGENVPISQRRSRALRIRQ